MLMVRAAVMAVAISTPTMACVVAFLVYSGSGHQLTPAIVFSSLTWFQLLRLPLMMLRKLRDQWSYARCVLILWCYSLVLGYDYRCAKRDWSSPGVLHSGTRF
jgi:hypothetical protein